MSRKDVFERVLQSGPSRFSGKVDGWSVATNGHVFVAVAEAVDSAETSAPPAIEQFFREKFGDITRRPVDVAALRAWCTADACGECAGSGVTTCQCASCGDEHEATCGECDRPRWGRFRGGLVDRRLLQDALALHSEGDCSAAWREMAGVASGFLVLVGSDWKAAVAGGRADGLNDGPEFAEAPESESGELSTARRGSKR